MTFIICFIVLFFALQVIPQDPRDVKFNVKFVNSPILEDNAEVEGSYFIRNHKNRKYQCYLPNIIEAKKEIKYEDVDLPNTIVGRYNNKCFEYVTRDYWNFSICIGQNVTQYHKEEDGVIRGDNFFLLGSFKAEQNWTIESARNVSVNSAFHTQQYTEGAECQPKVTRSAEVRFMCGYSREEVIITGYHEDPGCQYIFLVEMNDICDIPSFKSHIKNVIHSIICKPLMTAIQYEEYLTDKNVNQPKVGDENNVIKDESDFKEFQVSEDNSMGKTLNDLIQSVFSQVGMNQDDFDELVDKESAVKNTDTKTIIEIENGKPVYKWRVTYSSSVPFDKILEHTSKMRLNSMSYSDQQIESLRLDNIHNTNPSNSAEKGDKRPVKYFVKFHQAP